ncbi:MAG: hypothetical protein ACRDL4_15115 [Thermoleophilaceae bacterium]
MDELEVDRSDRLGGLLELTEELGIRAESVGAWCARLELTFNRIERWVLTYDDGHVRIREFRRGLEASWMPVARREFEAGLSRACDEAVAAGSPAKRGVG